MVWYWKGIGKVFTSFDFLILKNALSLCKGEAMADATEQFARYTSYKTEYLEAGERWVNYCTNEMTPKMGVAGSCKLSPKMNTLAEGKWYTEVKEIAVAERRLLDTPARSPYASGYTTSQLRDVMAGQLQHAQRMTGSPMPMDAQPSYSGSQPDRTQEMLGDLLKEVKLLNGRVGQLEKNNPVQ